MAAQHPQRMDDVATGIVQPSKRPCLTVPFFRLRNTAEGDAGRSPSRGRLHPTPAIFVFEQQEM